MTDYRILNYKIKYNGPLKNNPFPKSSNLMWAYGTNEDDYYHNEFGLYKNDDKRALGHAMGILQKINGISITGKDRDDLLYDYKNYIYCLGLGNADRTIAAVFTDLLLGYGMFHEVYSVVSKYLEECNANNEGHDSIDQSQAMDFMNTYIKAGDVCLFCNNDPDLAIKYYELAGAKWTDDESLADQKSYNNFDNDPIEKAKWKVKAESLSNILLGNYLSVKGEALNLFDISIYNRGILHKFRAAMESAKKYDLSCNERINAFLGSGVYEINDISDYSRLFAILVESIKRNCMISVLYALSKEEKEIQNQYISDIVKAVNCIDNNDFSGINNYVGVTESPDALIVLQLVKAYVTVYFIKDSLAVDPDNSVCSYYTSLDTFSYLLPSKCSGSREMECGRLSIMNVSYMNDPNEGKVIRKYIYGDDEVIRNNSERKSINVGYDFIKCFTSKIDYLPMWQMYGDKAKGICAVLNIKNMKNLQLYHICYVNKTKSGYSIRKEDNEGIDTEKVKTYLKDIINIYKKLKMDEEKKAFDCLLGPIHYLFKDNSYSYEREMRMIYRFNSRSKLFKHTNQNPPKLYVLSSDAVTIDELILGPKFDNVSEAAPYLSEQLDEMAEKTSTNTPKISISNIDFR